MDILDNLKELGIALDLYEHPAVFTNEESERVCTMVPGKNAKNLFLTNDKASAYYLLTVAHGKRADLKRFSAEVGEKKLHFASAKQLKEVLGLTPGSVSPLGLINDAEKRVKFYVDAELLNEERIYVHPNRNTATVGIKTGDFKIFLAHLGYEIKMFKHN